MGTTTQTVKYPGIRSAAFGLVGGKDHMRRPFPQDVGKDFIGRGNPGAGAYYTRALQED